MKRIFAVVGILIVALTGCARADAQLDRAINLRQKLLSGNGCTFNATVTADYGDKVYTFDMNCNADTLGNLSFAVLQPDTIAGITGKVEGEKGKLTFDDQALMFDLIADGYVSPVSAPWLFTRTLRSGYIQGCESYDDGLHLQIDDSYADDALRLDIWTNGEDMPIQVEILWQGRRILSIQIENFTIL